MLLPFGDHQSQASGATTTRAPAALDFSERALLLVLYVSFVLRLAPSVGDDPLNLLLLTSESLTVLLILFRAPGSIATGMPAWTVALIGTLAPLLAAPGGSELIAPVVAGLMMMLGLVVSLAA